MSFFCVKVSSISNILDHLRPLFRGFSKTAYIWSLFFVSGAVLLSGVLVPKPFSGFALPPNISSAASGGPVDIGSNKRDVFSTAVASYQVGSLSGEDSRFVLVGRSAVVAPQDPLTNLITVRNGVRQYKVRTKDTLTSIAAQFGVSVETLRLVNSGLGSLVRPGQQLTILPVSGILYQLKDGDSLELVASRYGISPDAIEKYNPDYQKLFSSGNGTIVLPNAKPL